MTRRVRSLFTAKQICSRNGQPEPQRGLFCTGLKQVALPYNENMSQRQQLNALSGRVHRQISFTGLIHAEVTSVLVVEE